MTDTTKFFFVWNPSGHAPSFRHPDMQSARTEADRMARLNPNQQFWVLEAKGFCRIANPDSWTKATAPDGMPF